MDGLYNLTASPDGSLWLATREGALHSTDGGQSWQHILGGLPPREVLAVRYDAQSQRLLATAVYADAVFESKDGGQKLAALARHRSLDTHSHGVPGPNPGGFDV